MVCGHQGVGERGLWMPGGRGSEDCCVNGRRFVRALCVRGRRHLVRLGGEDGWDRGWSVDGRVGYWVEYGGVRTVCGRQGRGGRSGSASEGRRQEVWTAGKERVCTRLGGDIRGRVWGWLVMRVSWGRHCRRLGSRAGAKMGCGRG